MFDDYIKQLNETPSTPTQYVGLSIGDTCLTPYVLEDKLNNINVLSDRELYELLSIAYPTILNKTFIDKNKVITGNLFRNERFVMVFSQVLMNVRTPFDQDQKTNCNRLIYDYIMYKNKDNHIMSLLYNLAKTINRDIIPQLCGLGLSESIATDLAIARYSTTDEALGMMRVNVVITCGDIDVMNEQRIIWIYEKLFDHLTPMFEGIMFDAWSDDDFVDEDKEEIYGTINLAILDILNEAPLKSIVSVLSSFAQDKYYIHQDDPLRFNIKSIAVSDYGRIIEGIDIVETQRGITIPEY